MATATATKKASAGKKASSGKKSASDKKTDTAVMAADSVADASRNGSATATKNRRRPDRGASLTGEQNAERGFTASKKLGENLQLVLVDLIELASQGKQAHWNVVGRNFRDTHRQLDEVIEAARRFSDVIAERMRALHVVPDGRSDTVAESTTLAEFPGGEISTTDVVDLITERLEEAVSTCRDVHDQVDDEDPTSADLLHEVIETLEQYAWMVSAENRTPERSGKEALSGKSSSGGKSSGKN